LLFVICIASLCRFLLLGSIHWLHPRLKPKALLASEGVDLRFTDDAIRAIAELSEQINKEVENIGARQVALCCES
jgi:hypothetical protein